MAHTYFYTIHVPLAWPCSFLKVGINLEMKMIQKVMMRHVWPRNGHGNVVFFQRPKKQRRFLRWFWKKWWVAFWMVEPICPRLWVNRKDGAQLVIGHLGGSMDLWYLWKMFQVEDGMLIVVACCWGILRNFFVDFSAKPTSSDIPRYVVNQWRWRWCHPSQKS